MSIWRNILTGKDNETHDLGRYSWAICLLAVIGAAAANWWHGTVIDLVALATALGLVVASHAAALKIKADTEPTETKESP